MSSHVGKPDSILDTPLREISPQQFQSIRERVVKESPRLYKTRMLSDPTKVVNFSPGSAGATLNNTFNRNDSKFKNLCVLNEQVSKIDSLNDVDRAGKKVGELSMSQEAVKSCMKTSQNVKDDEFQRMKEIGTYENPVLDVFARRIVNKEWEIKKIMFNISSLFIWNLVYKFVMLFLRYTKRGENLCHGVVQLLLARVVFKVNPHANIDSIWFKIWNIENLILFVHIVLLSNILISLYMLFVRSQNVWINDLGLNEKQRRLLGVSEDAISETTSHEVLLSGNSMGRPISSEIKSEKNNELNDSRTGTQTFLFKSLQTPLRSNPSSKEQQHESQQPLVEANKLNLHEDVRKSALLKAMASKPPAKLQLPNINGRPSSGYIPSSKYAYIMDFPSPRRKL